MTRYYRELVAPLGGGHSLVCLLERRGRTLGLIVLGREWEHPFQETEVAQMRELRNVLTLGLAAVPSPVGGHGRSLQVTARERELCELLALGYQNREIAAALGTSPHTVRNQLARLFDKVDVTTRAELVGRWLGQ